MRRLVCGVIGHVDHGKTALVRALTGQDTDRLPEEKARGISIALGFAHLHVGADTDIDLIDMPGHERFVRTMISGATGIDAVLLVVAANEGIKPQTIEHIDIASLLGLRRAVIAITKTDLVAPEHARRVADEVAALTSRCGLDPLPPVMTSALQARGIEDVRTALAAIANDQQPRTSSGIAYLPIDRAFSVAGHGPVVTGTLRGAPLNSGDTLELLPSRRVVRVRGLQVHGAAVAAALPGQRVAVNLRDIEIAELARGMTLAVPNSIAPSDWLTIALRAVASAPPLRNGIRVRALLGTSEVDARLRLLDRDVLEPGQSGLAQLHCAEPVAVPAREHLVLRIASPATSVGGGMILDTEPRRLRRHCVAILQRLQDLRDLPCDALVAAEVSRAGLAGMTLKHLSRLSSLAAPSVVELLARQPVIVTRLGVVVAKADFDPLLARIPALLQAHGGALSREKLLAALPPVTLAVLDAALDQLLSARTLVERAGQWSLPRPEEDRARALDEAELASHIAQLLQRAGLTPPNPGTLVTSTAAKRAVDRLLREGVIVRAVDRAKGREMLFHRDAIKEARRRLEPLLATASGLLVTEIGAALGISRKYTMPLLDHLDSIRFTRRIDDRRVRA